MKTIIMLKNPRSQWAKDFIKKRGPVVQMAHEKEDKFRVVGVDEEDVKDFKRWSTWLAKSEVDFTVVGEMK